MKKNNHFNFEKLSFKKVMKKVREITINSSKVIFWLSVYFGTVLNLSFWRFVFNHVEITDGAVFVFAVSLFFFMVVPFFLLFNLLVVPFLAKGMIVFFLLTSSITNYLMVYLGVYIDTDMVRNAFETNTREAFDLITLPSVLWVVVTGVMPACFITLIKIKYDSLGREVFKRAVKMATSLMIIGVFALTSYKQYASFGRNNREVRKLLNTINYTYSTVRYFQLQAQADRQFKILDENAKLVPFEDPHLTVLVFILGETARTVNFSLFGYERKTNPLLEKQDVVTFDNVSSCGTATAVSVPCMFSSQGRSDFNVTDAKYTENLVDILQKAGYDILWRENDDGCKGVCDRVPTENMLTLNNPKYCKGTYCYDEALLDGLDDKLKNIKKDTVIFLHMMGSHGPTYYNRYPDRFKKFTPTCDTADIQNCAQETIVNTYDNTIVYTDYIISSVIDMLKKYPQYESGMIYVSDHGESLGENNMYLHGFPYRIAPKEQTHVPVILWMSETMKKWDYVDYACMKKEADNNSYTHDNLFHSVAGLLEIKTKVYQKDLDIFKNCRTKQLPALTEP
jgi:lipid A ethanolaminephosphotransferase